MFQINPKHNWWVFILLTITTAFLFCFLDNLTCNKAYGQEKKIPVDLKKKKVIEDKINAYIERNDLGIFEKGLYFYDSKEKEIYRVVDSSTINQAKTEAVKENPSVKESEVKDLYKIKTKEEIGIFEKDFRKVFEK